jgi:hypothetical protein
MWSRHSNVRLGIGAAPGKAESLIGPWVDNAPSGSGCETIANFTSVTTAHSSHCRHTTTAHPRAPAANMSDNENNDNGEEMVTKPFKFVTGEHFPRLRNT